MPSSTAAPVRTMVALRSGTSNRDGARLDYRPRHGFGCGGGVRRLGKRDAEPQVSRGEFQQSNVTLTGAESW